MKTPKCAFCLYGMFLLVQLAVPVPEEHLGTMPWMVTWLSLRFVPVFSGHRDWSPIVVNTGVPYTGSLLRKPQNSRLHTY
jgi:hypothetical protein